MRNPFNAYESLLLLVIIFFLPQCRPEKTEAMTDTEIAQPQIVAWQDSIVSFPSIVYVNTISYRTYDYKYVFFGVPDDYGLYLCPDDELFPHIPGLHQYYAEVVSPHDPSIRARFALGLRCPEMEPILLEWISQQLHEGVPSFFGNTDDLKCTAPVSIDAIASFYLKAFEQAHRKGLAEVENFPEHNIHTAAGLLLTDCWQNLDLCTFYKAEWNEWVWAKEYYYTIDKRTGDVLGLVDFIDEVYYERLGREVILRLENEKGERYDVLHQFNNGVDILSLYDSCALIDEGLIFTFPLGVFASNAEGRFRAVIPYEEIRDILNLKHMQ